MTQIHAEGDSFREAAELFAHRLAHWLQRLEPRAAFGGVDAKAVGRVTVEPGGNSHLSIPESEARRGVDAAHLVGLLGQDGPLVPFRFDGRRLPLRRQQLVFAHQPQHAPQGGAHASQAQPRPHLAVAIAVKGLLRNRAPDLAHQLLVRVGCFRAASGGRRGEAS